MKTIAAVAAAILALGAVVAPAVADEPPGFRYGHHWGHRGMPHHWRHAMPYHQHRRMPYYRPTPRYSHYAPPIRAWRPAYRPISYAPRRVLQYYAVQTLMPAYYVAAMPS